MMRGSSHLTRIQTQRIIKNDIWKFHTHQVSYNPDIFFVTNDWFPKRVHHSLAQTIITWSHKSRFTDLLSPTPCARQSISFLSLHTVTSPMYLCKVFPGKHILTRGWLYSLFLSHQGKIDNGWWDVAIAKREGIYFAQREPNVIFSTYFRALFSVGVGVTITTVEKM